MNSILNPLNNDTALVKNEIILTQIPNDVNLLNVIYLILKGWSGGALVLGKLPVPGRPTSLMIVGQGPIALAVGAGGGCLNIFTLLCPFSLSPSLWETARYRLK